MTEGKRLIGFCYYTTSSNHININTSGNYEFFFADVKNYGLKNNNLIRYFSTYSVGTVKRIFGVGRYEKLK